MRFLGGKRRKINGKTAKATKIVPSLRRQLRRAEWSPERRGFKRG
jgi:hypothetical protein